MMMSAKIAPKALKTKEMKKFTIKDVVNYMDNDPNILK